MAAAPPARASHAARASHGVSVTDVATWLTWAAALFYVLDVLRVPRLLRRLPRFGPHIVAAGKWLLPRSPWTRWILALVGIGASVGLAFTSGLDLRITLVCLFAVPAVAGITYRLWQEIHQEGGTERRRPTLGELVAEEGDLIMRAKQQGESPPRGFPTQPAADDETWDSPDSRIRIVIGED